MCDFASCRYCAQLTLIGLTLATLSCDRCARSLNPDLLNNA
jgi:hypothetical protein